MNRIGSTASNDPAAAAKDLSSSLADVALLFTMVKEGLQTGFKKQCVYEIRAVKESGNMRPLNPEERLTAVKDGSSQLIMRYARECKSLMELQLGEKNRARQRLIEDGAPPSKVYDLENRFHARLLEAIRKQQTKAIMSICGLTLDIALLAPPPSEEGGNFNDLSDAMKRKMATEMYADADDIDLDEDDLDEIGDAFGDEDIVSGKGSFQTAVLDWFKGVMSLQKQYTKVPFFLLRRFKTVMTDMLEEIEDDETPVQGQDEFAGYAEQVTDNQGRYTTDDVESALSITCAAGSISLKALLEGFLSQVDSAAKYCRGNENGVAQAAMSSVRDTFANIISTSEVESALNNAYASKNARNIIEKLYRDQFNEFFSDIFSYKDSLAAGNKSSIVRTASDKLKNLSKSENNNPKPERSESTLEVRKREEQLMKALDAKVEKKRKELQDHYSRAKEGRGGLGSIEEENEYESMQNEAMTKLDEAYEDVRSMVSASTSGSTNELLNIVSAEGLLAAIERKLEGNDVEVTDLKTIQSEVEKDLERKEATRLRKVQSVEAEKLDVMLKVQRAREQQALQKRLLARKKSKNGGKK